MAGADDDELVGAKAIAAHLGKTEERVDALLRRGYLPGFKVGKRWHMRKREFNRMIDALTEETLRRAAADRSR
jgi:hypothetical protein